MAVLVLVLDLRVIGKVRELLCGGAQHRRVGPGVSGWGGALAKKAATTSIVLAMSPRTAPTTEVWPGRLLVRGPSLFVHGSGVLLPCLRRGCGLSQSVAGL